jgi:hypothetical protein
MLHNVYASLVGQYGWDAAARTDPTLKTGNAVFLHLFLDSLLLQPCNPTCKVSFRFSMIASGDLSFYSRLCS